MFIAYIGFDGGIAIRNLGEKLLALVIGFLLWNYVVSQGSVEITMRVPVEFVNLPDNVEVEGAPSWVEVRLEGAPWVVKKLGLGDVKVQVLLKDTAPGERVVSFNMVRVPEGVRVISVKPARAKVKVVPLVEKEVPVLVRWRRRPKKKWRVRPFSVKVVGPERLVSKIKYIATSRIDPSSLKEGEEIPLVVPKGVVVEPERVILEVENG